MNFIPCLTAGLEVIMFYQSNTAAALQFPCAVMSEDESTALYCRLSQDDGMEGDSNSIINQELICKGWFLPPRPCLKNKSCTINQAMRS